MKFDGRVAIVTGGARGIGRATARRLLADGARVVIADIDGVAGSEAASALAELGPIRFVAADVGEAADVARLVATAEEAFGGIDYLVGNAGIALSRDFLDLTEAEFARVIRTNLTGMFLTGQAVARRLVERVRQGGRPGAMVLMSSVNAVMAIATQVPYSASKGGVNQLTKAMALALAPHGIRVNAVGPGSIDTDMLAGVAEDPAAKGRILSRTPLGRIGSADEIAGIVAFLLSDDASYLTGQTIYADGGRLPLNYVVPVAAAPKNS